MALADAKKAQTVINLGNNRTETISRATELGLSTVTAEDVQKARNNF